MKVSLKWLEKYVDVHVPIEELASKLTMAGLEVESMDNLGQKYEKFLVAEVLEVKPHPNADKLTVCRVNTGKETLSIVCGAPNVASGQKVPVALVGATIPHDQHDPEGRPFTLEKALIRGVESNGMICSEFELGLGSDAQGIMVLDQDAPIGMPLARYLGLDDVILEIAVTPNRPDCLSHIGIAREVAALFGLKVKKPVIKLTESSEQTAAWASVEILDLENCPRYSARVVRDVRVEPSPKWLQDQLRAVGVRTVNNVVDITNFVLLELGHPLHAFDYDRLEGKKIVVRKAKEGEHFVTLDGKGRSLTSETLMICDAVRPVAIAGVMGGANTEISDSTRNILIESAYFSPRSIRRTSKRLGVSTDASQRFERGADPSITIAAVNRCAQLIQKVCGGVVLKGVIDIYPKKIFPKKVSLRFSRVNEILGTALSPKKVSTILTSLEFSSIKRTPSKTPKRVLIQVPTFRPDIEREIDLIEEVARIYGYENIETKMGTALKFASQPVPESLADRCRDVMIASGYRELVTNSLQKKSVASLSGQEFVEVQNPISEDMAALRTSLIPGMLEVIRHNIYHGTEDLRLFEIGNIFRRARAGERGRYFPEYLEQEVLGLAVTGRATPPGWDSKSREVDIYDLKGDIELLLGKIFLDKVKSIYYSTTNTLTELSVSIEINGSCVGFFGKISSSLRKLFDIERDVFAAELSLDVLRSVPRRKITFESLPKYPPVSRDLAFVVDERTPVGEVEKAIRDSGGDLLKSIQLFDLYKGDQIPAGKKSCAFSLEFISLQRTLTDEEIDKTTRRIVEYVKRALGAELRG